MKKMHENPIWIVKEDEPSIITRGKLLIADETQYNQIVAELQDIKNCHSIGTISFKETPSTDVRIDLEGYYNREQNERLERAIYKIYANPREAALRLMTGQKYNRDIALLSLFTAGNTTKEKIAQLHIVRTLLDQLAQSSLDRESLKTIINHTWPSFGYFATECLQCTTIETIETYCLDDLKEIKRLSEKASIAVAEPVTNILQKEQTATTNGKVLQLARQAQKISS